MTSTRDVPLERTRFKLTQKSVMGLNGAEPSQNTIPWYAIAVRARCEKSVLEALERLDLDVFLPLINERKAWQDRVKDLEIALFPGYLFVHDALIGPVRYRLVDTRDVIGVVGHNQERVGSPIPEQEIENVRIMVERGSELAPCDAFAEGSAVRVVQGPLQGVEGVFERVDAGRSRIICTIGLLGRSVQASIQVEHVVKLEDAPQTTPE